VNRNLAQHQEKSLLDDPSTVRKIELNHIKNRDQDHSAEIDRCAASFDYASCSEEWWNPPEFSLLYATPLWEQSTESQRIVLNHLYWVAYYSQIISAEIATILLNQTSAAGLSSYEDFRSVCDMLDLETMQERSHIAAFKRVGEAVEEEIFGERLFTYPMRSMYVNTMIFADDTAISRFWRNIQLRAFSLLSSGNAFIGCQYFAVRGLRTLNGKMVQHGLAQITAKAEDREATPAPSRISYYHFLDESYHFHSSRILTHDVIRSLPDPTPFERFVANQALAGCQRDHFHVSVAVKGLFWYEPALLTRVHRLLRSRVFAMDEGAAREMLWKCFADENEAVHESFAVHQRAVNAYRKYLDPLAYVNRHNKSMAHMSRNTVPRYLAQNQRSLRRLGLSAS
jgi:hypothetical protein